MRLLEEARLHLEALGRENQAFTRVYPGDRGARQPIHTVYGGAQLYKAETTVRLGELALRSLASYGRDALEFARGVGFAAPGSRELDSAQRQALRTSFERDPEGLRLADPDAWLAHTVHDRVRKKLEREAVEDFRIDFEDGFGARPDAEEDQVAVAAAREVARGMTTHLLPPFIGIRIKSMGEEWRLRATRTLEIFLDTLLEATGRKLPDNFVVTLPKVTIAGQPRTLVRLFELMERRHGLPPGALRMEIMIETTQALLAADGRSPLPDFLAAAEGRCVAAHLGTYDYTASCNITAAYQQMDHPMCDLAKGLMMLAYAGTGIFLSDGATNVMPVGPHRARDLTDQQRAENRAQVHAAWQLGHRHIRHSLEGGFYQGWDLHPAQIPVRYAACYSFFLEGFAAAAERLKNFVEKAAQATLIGDVFDDAATGQGLLNYFLRALNCGAIDVTEIAQTGLTTEEFGLRSFAKILEAKKTRIEKTRIEKASTEPAASSGPRPG
jgi:citrate lyase beta subunit